MDGDNNFACKIFKDQIELILQLPEKERAEVLYRAILWGFNQIENQNDSQIENQNENALMSMSTLSNKIYNLIKRNILWKEISNNYGGYRKGSGRKKQTIVSEPKPIEIPKPRPSTTDRYNPVTNPPTLEEVLAYAAEQTALPITRFSCNRKLAESFFNHYSSQGWIKSNKMPMTDWRKGLGSWVDKHSEFSKEDIPIAPRPFRDDSKKAKGEYDAAKGNPV